MKWLNVGSSLFLMALSVMIFVSSMELGFGSFQAPGAGFLGFLASLLLFILSLAVLLSTVCGRSTEVREQSDMTWQSMVKPASLAAAMCAYALVLGTAGFLLSTTLLLFTMFFMYEPKKFLLHIVVSLVVANGSYILFQKWLGVVLPSGILGIGW